VITHLITEVITHLNTEVITHLITEVVHLYKRQDAFEYKSAFLVKK